MAKNRKTKKEKLRSSARISHMPKPSHDDIQASDQRNVFTFVSSSPIPNTRRNQTNTTIYHLREDLLRTGTVIFAITIAELILFYTLAIR